MTNQQNSIIMDLDEVLVEQFYAFWREWFAQPEEVKRKHLRQSSKGGWYPPGSEAPGYEAKADPKEYFHWRLNTRGRPSNFATTAIFKKCLAEARTWLYARGMDQLADLPSENHVLRILHYPPSPDGNVGQAHCDFDLLTVSVPGTVPGLEVFDEGEWIKRETFEVHVGEMLTHYAKIPFTPHRVRTPPNTERYKAVFFYLPPMDFELRPGFTAADYLKIVLSKAGTINVGAPK